MYLTIVGLSDFMMSDFGMSETNAKLYRRYDFLYCFMKLHATSNVLNSVRDVFDLTFLSKHIKYHYEYFLGLL